MDESERDARSSDAGGLGELVVGIALLGLGAWMFLGRVAVRSGAPASARTWFAIALVPLVAGVALLALRPRSTPGRALMGAGAVAVLGPILNDLQVYFRSTTLVGAVAMLSVLAAGFGMVLRGARARA